MIFLLYIVISMLIIWRASDGFEASSNYLGRNLSEGVKGATINAIGSSIPELLTTFVALLVYLDREGFAFGAGTTAGSAIFNSALIPAFVILTVVLTGVVKKVEVSKKVILRDGLSLLIAEGVLIVVLSNGTLDWYHGLILMGTYAAYITYMLTSMKTSESTEDDDGDEEEKKEGSRLVALLILDLKYALFKNKNLNNRGAWTLLAFSISVISFACWILVEACYGLGDSLGIMPYFVAVLLAAAATSVPDTILSIKDAKAGNYEDAVANALGSNIFDICICLGLPLFIFSLIYGPITMEIAGQQSVAELRVLLFGFTFIAVLIYLFGKGMGIVKAIGLIGMYFLFGTYIITRAYGNVIAAKIGNYLQSVLQWVNL